MSSSSSLSFPSAPSITLTICLPPYIFVTSQIDKSLLQLLVVLRRPPVRGQNKDCLQGHRPVCSLPDRRPPLRSLPRHPPPRAQTPLPPVLRQGFFSILFLLVLFTFFCVKVVRSPDGQSATFPLGNLSVQRAAAHVLEKYYVEFPVYNPYLETLPGTKGRKGASSSYKVYDIDGGANDGNSTVVSQASKGRGHSSHNERYYEEDEYERKVRKRRARLLTAAEESFTHIRRMRQEHSGGRKQALSPYEAAQAVFPSLSRSLQKYLRVTR